MLDSRTSTTVSMSKRTHPRRTPLKSGSCGSADFREATAGNPADITFVGYSALYGVAADRTHVNRRPGQVLAGLHRIKSLGIQSMMNFLDRQRVLE